MLVRCRHRSLGSILVYVMSLLSTIVLSEVPADAKKDDLMDIIAPAVIGGTIGEGLGSAVRSAFELRNTVAESNLEYQAVRARYWAEYPDGKNFAQAEAEFSRLLELKDLLYLGYAFMDWLNDKKIDHARFFHTIAGQQLDSGIPSPARGEFEEWVEAVLESVGKDVHAGKDLMSTAFTLMPTAIQRAPKQYQTYKLERDWAEFDAAGRLPKWVETPHGGALYLIYRFGKEKPERAAEIYKEMVEVFGEDHVHEAARKVRNAGISKAGGVIDTKSLQVALSRTCDAKKDGTPDECEEPIQPGFIYAGTGSVPWIFNTLLGSGEPKYYVMGLHFTITAEVDRTEGKVYWDWKQAQKFYQEIIAAYGEDAVRNVATTLLAAPKTSRSGKLKNPAEFGAPTIDRTYFMMRHLLARQNPRGYVRLLSSHDSASQKPRECFITGIYKAWVKPSGGQDGAKTIDQMEKEFRDKYSEIVNHGKPRPPQIDEVKNKCRAELAQQKSDSAVGEYPKLEAKYGSETLQRAGQALVSFWAHPEWHSPTCRDTIDAHIILTPKQVLFYEGKILNEILNGSPQPAAGQSQAVSMEEVNKITCKS